MPAASIEIAIGMKTISLNAVPQRTRSVSTAKISPSAVATVGATTTQMTLFLQRGADGVVGEHRLVVVEPDEAVAGLVEEAAEDRVPDRVDDQRAEQHQRGQQEQPPPRSCAVPVTLLRGVWRRGRAGAGGAARRVSRSDVIRVSLS